MWETSLHNPSFAAYANLCGGKGFKVSRVDKLESALSQALQETGPSLVEIMTDPDLI